MPQTEPMTELKSLLGFDAGYGVVKCKRVEWEAVQTIIAQRDRAILEAAADRYCLEICDMLPEQKGNHCPCSQRKAILAPLEKGEV